VLKFEGHIGAAEGTEALSPPFDTIGAPLTATAVQLSIILADAMALTSNLRVYSTLL